MRTFLVLMTVLCLSTAAQATHHHVPISNLPAPWQGECIVYTRADNDFHRTIGLPPTTHHRCTLITHGVRTKLELTLTMPMRGLFRRTTLTIHPSHAAPETSLTFHFPDGDSVTLPKASYVIGLHEPATGWQGREAQALIQRMMTEPSVALRFQPSSVAVEFDKLPAGGYTETFSIAHFAEAWKKLTETIWALPAL